MRRSSAIFLGGLTAGTIDITYAVVFSHFRGVGAMRLLQSVASGVLGTEAYKGGIRTATFGLFLHFLIAFIWTIFFVLASGALPFLARRAAWTGPFYGLLIYGLMNLVVLPLSAFPHPIVFRTLPLVTGLIVHMFGIGLVIALFARRAMSPDSVLKAY